MKKTAIVQAALASLIFVACVTGCQRGEKFGPVSGTVTFLGKPVTKGAVTFSNSNKGIYGTAMLNAEGQYEVITDEGAGLPPGEYLVMISPPLPDIPLGPVVKPVGMPASRDIPFKYRNPKTSGLSLTVTEAGNTFDIDMQP